MFSCGYYVFVLVACVVSDMKTRLLSFVLESSILQEKKTGGCIVNPMGHNQQQGDLFSSPFSLLFIAIAIVLLSHCLVNCLPGQDKQLCHCNDGGGEDACNGNNGEAEECLASEACHSTAARPKV